MTLRVTDTSFHRRSASASSSSFSVAEHVFDSPPSHSSRFPISGSGLLTRLLALIILSIAWRSTFSWISTIDRTKANELAGVPVPPSDDKEVKSVPEAIQKDTKSVLVPIFHIVDDSDTTQNSLASVVSSVFGISFSFSNALQNQVAKFKMQEVAEDINEHHMEGWTKLLMTAADEGGDAAAGVVNTPLTPYAHVHQLEKHGFGADGGKIKKVRSASIGPFSSCRLLRPSLNLLSFVASLLRPPTLVTSMLILTLLSRF